MPHAQVPDRTSLRYRADIDGLRAVAVVPVVFYHFGVRPFSGGFVGVDVFFVISGFLITGLIYAELGGGSFSILRFYERRIRRIFPALFAMIAAAIAVGLLVLFPHELMRLAQSAAATTVFGSNFDFWRQAGYFDVGANLKPLLHTWSLAVEEQFYVLFPALLYVNHSRRRAVLLGLVAVLGVISFVASLWAIGRSPTAAFYLTPFRTWELMLGAVLALGAFPAPKTRWLGEAVSLAGLGAIGWAVFSFTVATPFPGANALFPCAGAAALIYAGSGENTWTRRLLASPPLVGIGLISYSLYLWHWPIHVFADYVAGGPAGAAETVLLIALSFALGFLSWRYVERPFRGSAIPRATIFRLAGVAVAATLLLSGLLFVLQGLPQRFAPDIRRIFAEGDDNEPRRHECFNRIAADVAAGRICTIGDAHAPAPELPAVGRLPIPTRSFRRSRRRRAAPGARACSSGMAAVRRSWRYRSPTSRRGAARQLNQAALDLLRRDKIGEVILDARWPHYDQGTGFGPDASQVGHLIDLDPRGGHDADQHAGFARMLERTVRLLVAAHIKVVLVTPVPEPGFDVPQTLARDALQGIRGRPASHARAVPRAQRQRAARFRRSGAALRRHAGRSGGGAVCERALCARRRRSAPLHRPPSFERRGCAGRSAGCSIRSSVRRSARGGRRWRDRPGP